MVPDFDTEIFLIELCQTYNCESIFHIATLLAESLIK